LLSIPNPDGRADDAPPHDFSGPAQRCEHRAWASIWKDWKADLDRLCGELQRYEGEGNGLARRLFAAMNLPLLALFLHRLSHWLHCNGRTRLARAASAVNLLLFRLAIHPRSCLGGGVLMPHLSALSVDGSAGPKLTIYANCVVLPRGSGPGPVLGAGVALGGHAGILGSSHVGDGVLLAPKVQLLNSAPSGAQAFSPMSRVKRLAAGEYERPSERSANWQSGTEPPDAHECRPRDRERLRKIAPDAPFTAGLSVALFRRAAARHRGGSKRRARALWRANMYLTGSDLAPDAVVGPGLVVPYPAGVSLFGTAGEDLTMHAQTMLVPEIDAAGPRRLSSAPLVGDRVTLDPHSGICGAARVGGDVRLLAGCILRDDAPDGVLVEPRPLRIRTAVEAAPAKR
jgi:serine O-acetyltransferase